MNAFDFLLRRGWYPRLRYAARMLLWELRRDYEEPEFYLLPHLVDPARAAVDVGGHYGSYAGKLAKLTPRVHCFEPDASMASLLRLRLAASSVVVHQAAASNRTGTAELVLPRRADGTCAGELATIERDNPVAASLQAQGRTVEVVRLDDVVREPVGFVKIDVEGHELAVLQGMRRILGEDRPVLLVEAARIHNPSSPTSVFDFVRGLGYEGVFLLRNRLTPLAAYRDEVHQRVGPDGRPDPSYVFNFIFLPRDSGSRFAALA